MHKPLFELVAKPCFIAGAVLMVLFMVAWARRERFPKAPMYMAAVNGTAIAIFGLLSLTLGFGRYFESAWMLASAMLLPAIAVTHGSIYRRDLEERERQRIAAQAKPRPAVPLF